VKRRKHDPPRFFVEGVHAIGDVVDLSGADARKLLVVLRGQAGDPLEICDSGGNTFAASLVADGVRAAARLEERRSEAVETSREIVLYQSVPKGAKMDFVIEKATELGVARIVPVTTERTIGAVSGDAKVERWNRLARTAAAQCGRSRVPIVDEPVAWNDVFRVVQDGSDLILFPWELAERVALRDALPELLTQPGRIAVLIGPEGGISHEEAAVAVAAGAHPISLGPRIFRTETAGMVLIAAVLYALGDV
jgi:16S rRNA (uracil1498-N3)-methyltransferase